MRRGFFPALNNAPPPKSAAPFPSMRKIHQAFRGGAPLLICLFLSAICCYAQSPIGNLFNNMSAEATGTWAVGGVLTAMVVGGLGMAFGHHDMKGLASKLMIGSAVALAAQGFLAWLRA